MIPSVKIIEYPEVGVPPWSARYDRGVPAVRRHIQLRLLAAAAGALAILTSCAPESPAPPTRLDITTQLTWCGGVIPPPGEPWCHTSTPSTAIEVRQRRDVIHQVTTGADGRAVVDVAPGTYVIAAADPPGYMECDAPMVTVAAGTTVAVVQTCTVFAP